MKKTMLVLTIFVAGITTAQKATKYFKPEVYSFKGNKIVFLDGYYSNFLEAVTTDSNYALQFDRMVLEPIFHYVNKGRYSKFVYADMFSLPFDTADLPPVVEELKKDRAVIELLISSAIKESNLNMRNDSITILITPFCDWYLTNTDPTCGLNAVATNPKQIIISINPRIAEWSTMLSYIVAREFYQTCWLYKHQHDTIPPDLLSYILYEGMGDSYAHFIYNHVNAPWSHALPDSALKGYWRKIKRLIYDTTTDNIMSVLYGSPDYMYMPWGGITLGYSIMQKAIEFNPDIVPQIWLDRDPEYFLLDSGYQ